jgi:transcriptional regulator with XRE-family HTH domain
VELLHSLRRDLPPEIALVERLAGMGYKQNEICDLTGQNVTWVSQTNNFRTDLPKAAFEKLLAGKLKRNVAVKLMSYPAADRDRLFHQAEKEEEEETAEALRDLQLEQEAHEDEAELAGDEQEEALEAGDTDAAEKAEKRKETATHKAKSTGEKKRETSKKAGTIKQGHIDKAAKKTGTQPRKAKMLSKADVEESWVNQLEQWGTVAELDPLTKEAYPKDLCRFGMNVALAILAGSRDPGKVIREFLVEKGKWKLPDATADDEDVGEVSAESLGGKKKKGRQPVAAADDE